MTEEKTSKIKVANAFVSFNLTLRQKLKKKKKAAFQFSTDSCENHQTPAESTKVGPESTGVAGFQCNKTKIHYQELKNSLEFFNSFNLM